MGALAVTKSPQLLDTAAPLVILLVWLPHNVMASVSLCFPKREEGVGRVGWGPLPALLGSLRCGGELATAKRLKHRERSSANYKAISVDMDNLMTVGPLDPKVERVQIIL